MCVRASIRFPTLVNFHRATPTRELHVYLSELIKVINTCPVQNGYHKTFHPLILACLCDTERWKRDGSVIIFFSSIVLVFDTTFMHELPYVKPISPLETSPQQLQQLKQSVAAVGETSPTCEWLALSPKETSLRHLRLWSVCRIIRRADFDSFNFSPKHIFY